MIKSLLLLLATGLLLLGSPSARADKLGPEFQVNTVTDKSQKFPVVASKKNGAFIVIWSSKRNHRNARIRAQLFNKRGEKRRGQFGISAYGRRKDEPSVAYLDDGRFVVVWNYLRTVYCQIFDRKGRPVDSEFQVSSHARQSERSPKVAALRNGRFVVIWSAYRNKRAAILGQTFNRDGSKKGNRFNIEDFSKDLPWHHNYYDINRIGKNSKFVVAYRYPAGDGSSIKGQFFRANGKKLRNPFVIGAGSDANGSPSIALLDRRKFLVTWTSDQDLLYRAFDFSGSPIGPLRIAASGMPHGAPKVSSAAVGEVGAVLTWAKDDSSGSELDVYARKIDKTGAPIGEAFRVNTFEDHKQAEPAAVGLTGGRYVIVWQSAKQDGSRQGVFGQRFQAPETPR